MSARAVRREAERRERKRLRRDGVTLYHGTTEALVPRIRREGLRAVHGTPPFLTDDEQRAAGYAMRAICLNLHERELAGRPELAPKLAIVTVRVDRARIVADPAHEGDYAAPDGVSACLIAGVRVLDVREQVPSPAVVTEFAELTLLARDCEHWWREVRPYARSGAA